MPDCRKAVCSVDVGAEPPRSSPEVMRGMPWPPGHGGWRSWGWSLARAGVIPPKLSPTVTTPSKVSILQGPVTVPHPPEGQGPQVLLPQGSLPRPCHSPQGCFHRRLLPAVDEWSFQEQKGQGLGKGSAGTPRTKADMEGWGLRCRR